MRKVATKAEMSLGNLQFYFKNKDELLKGMVDVYFERCGTDFNNSFLEKSPESKQETIRFLVDFGMDYAHSEIGAVFRELWSMAARNEEIRGQLHEYYKHFADELAKILAPYAKTADSTSKAVSLLATYFDGLGLVSCPLPVNKKEMADFITRIIDATLEGNL